MVAQRLIIFDLDGTLVNAYPAVTASVNHTLTALGFSKKSAFEIKRKVGWGDRQLLAQFVGEDFADRATRIYRPHHTQALRTGVRFLPGAKQLLVRLKNKGFLLAIASNRPTRFTRIILKSLGVLSLFDMVLCADKAPNPKPHPDMLWMIIKRLEVAKRYTLFVGDMTIDVNTGKRARVKTVAVSTGSSSIKELKSLKPLAIIARISALEMIINKELV